MLCSWMLWRGEVQESGSSRTHSIRRMQQLHWQLWSLGLLSHATHLKHNSACQLTCCCHYSRMHLQVVKAAGVVKDAAWVKGLHMALANRLSGGVLSRCRGHHMDGTSTNRKAMKEMEEGHPAMVNLPCMAHGLNLLVKDLGNGGKNKTACGGVLQDAKALVVAISDSEKIRALVHQQQMAFNGKVRHCKQCLCRCIAAGAPVFCSSWSPCCVGQVLCAVPGEQLLYLNVSSCTVQAMHAHACCCSLSAVFANTHNTL
jgi:hypothetical protein